MKKETSIWQKMGLHDWFLKKEQTVQNEQVVRLTPDDVFRYIVEKFHESIAQLSFASRVVFYHEYIVCFNPEDYNEFMSNKKGIFGIIINESVKQFYQALQNYRLQGKTVEPSSNKWVFRFVSNPDYKRGDKSFIGKLLPGSSQQKEDNLRVTFIPRQTGIAETFDVNNEFLKGFTYYSDGYYEVPYQEDLEMEGSQQVTNSQAIARLETIVPDREYSGKKIEYLMRDSEIIVTGKEDKRDAPHIFKIPSDWVNAPHLRIRYNKNDNNFKLASFGEKTILNETEVPVSDLDNMQWVDLPVNSRIVLNGIVGVNIFKS